MSLVGRNAVVTGGASGIGRGISLRLARDGANVAILDLNLAGAESVAAEIAALGRKSMACQTDVANRSQVQAAIDRVRKELGPVHILVNDAGIGKFVLLADMSEENWDEMIAIHLKGTFNCTKAAVQDMIDAKWGRIVNISSTAGLGGAAGLVHYSAAKAGIIGFTKGLAAELGPMGITVNAIAPGLIDTPILLRGGVLSERMKKFKEMTANRAPVRRNGAPEDIAAACSYLVSEDASFFTGQVVSPNGGMYM
jgi:NAD(P)-dependent dehydrogenase (short-subunit alcohol dehydrogenase family)